MRGLELGRPYLTRDDFERIKEAYAQLKAPGKVDTISRARLNSIQYLNFHEKSLIISQKDCEEAEDLEQPFHPQQEEERPAGTEILDR